MLKVISVSKSVKIKPKIQELGSALIELWNLIDMPLDEQKRFDRVTRFISASVDEVSGQGCLPLDVIEQTEIEVGRLNILKASKMKELILKKQNELEEIYKAVYIDVDNDTAQKILRSLIDSGNVDLSELLVGMDDQITKAKEQALSRREILDNVEKWRFACEEESWLDDYEMTFYLIGFPLLCLEILLSLWVLQKIDMYFNETKN